MKNFTRRSTSRTYSRRQITQGGGGLGLSGAALSAMGRAAAAHQASPEASPSATPAASPVVIGEELDLANLSPDIADPSEPVPISFMSWVAGTSNTLKALRDQFQELHPNIKVDFEDVPAEE